MHTAAHLHCEAKRMPPTNHGYNFVNSWSICKLFFTATKSTRPKFSSKPILGYPPHLKYVAVLGLPWKTYKPEIFCIFHARKTGWWITKLLWRETPHFIQQRPKCSKGRFPTGHYWHCNWPVEKVSSVMCLCKWWTFWTSFVNRLLQTTGCVKSFRSTLERRGFFSFWSTDITKSCAWSKFSWEFENYKQIHGTQMSCEKYVNKHIYVKMIQL